MINVEKERESLTEAEIEILKNLLISISRLDYPAGKIRQAAGKRQKIEFHQMYRHAILWKVHEFFSQEGYNTRVGIKSISIELQNATVQINRD